MKRNRTLSSRLVVAALAAAALFGAPSWVGAQAGGTAGTTTGGTTGPTAGSTTTTSAGFTGGSGSGTTSTATSTSFAGSTATQFSGGQGLSFSGGTTGTGTGAIGGTTRGGTSYAAPSPTSYNPFLGTYVMPLRAGATALSNTTSTGSATTSSGGRTSTTSTSSTAAIAQPLYPPSGTTTTGRTGVASGAGFGSVGGAGSSYSGPTYRGPTSSFTTYGTYRNPSYITTLDESIPIVAHAAPELQRSLQTMLDNSVALRKVRGLDVAVNSGTVVLRGAVGTERERKLVEGMVRLTPGVREVRNELSVTK